MWKDAGPFCGDVVRVWRMRWSGRRCGHSGGRSGRCVRGQLVMWCGMVWSDAAAESSRAAAATAAASSGAAATSTAAGPATAGSAAAGAAGTAGAGAATASAATASSAATPAAASASATAAAVAADATADLATAACTTTERSELASVERVWERSGFRSDATTADGERDGNEDIRRATEAPASEGCTGRDGHEGSSDGSRMRVLFERGEV